VIWLTLNDPARGCNSYLLGDEVTGTALAVDPLGALGPEAYVLAAQDLGLAIQHVVETHVHADHESAARELADALGIAVSLSHRAPVAFARRPLHDGEAITLGAIRVEVWETPGHTDDSLSLVVRDGRRGSDPWLVMTGDSLFVGDVGRPDLAEASPEAVREAAHRQFESIRRLMTLPDFTEVYPAHYGSSPCGGLFMSRKPQSTIGYERRFNRFVRIDDVDAFVDHVLSSLKPPPVDAPRIRTRNLGQAVL
jgi:hydroxyacylglutathione hydrolase